MATTFQLSFFTRGKLENIVGNFEIKLCMTGSQDEVLRFHDDGKLRYTRLEKVDNEHMFKNKLHTIPIAL